MPANFFLRVWSSSSGSSSYANRAADLFSYDYGYSGSETEQVILGEDPDCTLLLLDPDSSVVDAMTDLKAGLTSWGEQCRLSSSCHLLPAWSPSTYYET